MRQDFCQQKKQTKKITIMNLNAKQHCKFINFLVETKGSSIIKKNQNQNKNPKSFEQYLNHSQTINLNIV